MATPKDHVRNNAILRLKYGTGEERSINKVNSYADHPTYTFEDGTTWAAHLCEELTPEEEAAYWKERALKAESDND